MHKYIKEVYKYPYVGIDMNTNKKSNLVCPIPDCGATFGKITKANGQLVVSQAILFCDHFVKYHSGRRNRELAESNPFSSYSSYHRFSGVPETVRNEQRRRRTSSLYQCETEEESQNLAYMYGYSLKFMKWIVDVYIVKVQKQFKCYIEL